MCEFIDAGREPASAFGDIGRALFIACKLFRAVFVGNVNRTLVILDCGYAPAIVRVDHEIEAVRDGGDRAHILEGRQAVHIIVLTQIGQRRLRLIVGFLYFAAHGGQGRVRRSALPRFLKKALYGL